MHIVSIDIDPRHRMTRVHLGPFVAGLNAVYGSRGSGKSTIASFVRGLLYSRRRDRTGADSRGPDEAVGSLQWADANGNSRILSTSDPAEVNDYRSGGEYHWSSRLDAAGSAGGRPAEQPWHRIGGETFDAVFCGRLGETLPERLWAAARELGIAIRFDLEDDETYRRLRGEERRLQQRLHHLRVDDRDQAWWSTERNRLASRLDELSVRPARETQQHAAPEHRLGDVSLRARLAELDRREAELSRQIADGLTTAASNARTPAGLPADWCGPDAGRSTRLRDDAFGTWVGYSPRSEAQGFPPAAPAEDFDSLRRHVDSLRAHRDDIRSEIEGLRTKLDAVAPRPTAAALPRADAADGWEAEELRRRLAYADEVLQSWTLYEQTRTRLDEVQGQLRGHGPYRQDLESSFIKTVERYARELSAGALRSLPTWTLEALRRDQDYVTGLSRGGRSESYREVYRDYRPDASDAEFAVPPSTAPQRQIVELAMRLAIIESAAPRVGRLPLILDDALDGFGGPQLDHLVRVLIQFAQDGQQILLLTSEDEVASRVRGHRGWVATLTDPSAAQADGYAAAEMHTPKRPLRLHEPAAYTEPARDVAEDYFAAIDRVAAPRYPTANAEINRILSAEADDAASAFQGGYEQDQAVRSSDPAAPRRFFLSEDARVEDAPGVDARLASRLRKRGIASVRALIEADPQRLSQALGDLPTAGDLRHLQLAAHLMCSVPQLRGFDARVLVGCGVDHPLTLSQMRPAKLLRRLERFLGTERGQEILRSGTSYELSRITTWIISARQNVRQANQPRRDESPKRPSVDARPAAIFETPVEAPKSTRRTEPQPMQKVVATDAKYYLRASSPVVDAPSVGPRMAEALEKFGIVAVRDLMKSDPVKLAAKLGDRRVDGQVIRDWQDQSRLVCTVPNLRGHDAQILVACGVRSAETLAAADAKSLLADASAFARGKAGQRLLRGAAAPDAAEVAQWIAWARQRKTTRAA